MGAPMLDPDWTLERGYSHAARIMELLNRERTPLLDRRATTGSVRDLADDIGRGSYVETSPNSEGKI